MADVPYGLANPTQEALSNAAGIMNLMQGGGAGLDMMKTRLAFALQQKQAAFENQLAMQRQAQAQAFEAAQTAKTQEFQKGQLTAQQGFAAGQSDKEIKAQAALANLAQSGETSRENLRIGSSKSLAQAEAQRELDNRNAMLADQIRLDPRAKLLPNFDLGKYKPNDAKDNAALVQDWQKSATPAALEKVDASQVANLRTAASGIQNEIVNYPNTMEGQASIVRTLLQSPDIQHVLTTDMNVQSPNKETLTHGWGPKDFNSAMSGANVPAVDANGKPTGATVGMQLLQDALNKAQHGYFFGVDSGNVAKIQNALLGARASLFNPQTAPPILQQKFQNLQQITQGQQAIIGAGNIRTPQGWQQATGTQTPIADALRAASGMQGSAAPSAPAGAALTSPISMPTPNQIQDYPNPFQTPGA